MLEAPRVIELKEGVPALLPRDSLDESLAIRISETEGLEVDFPSPRTAFQYRLCSPNKVGQIPIGRDLLLRIIPKVPIQNIFQMLEVAYNLKSFRLGVGLVGVDALEGVIERLASILARRVLDRGRRGLYRSYIDESDRLSHLRGRLDIERTVRSLTVGEAVVHCSFQEHTSDLEENQILLWTLAAISRLRISRPIVAREVGTARRLLSGAASLTAFDASMCVGRLYNRLNADYEPMHGICRFFLENVGPGINHGEYAAIPFTVDMPQLFELFVAQWLATNAPPHLRIENQHTVRLDALGRISYRIDVIAIDASTDRPVAVLDTKYKAGEVLSEDIQQIIAYAAEMGVSKAFLVYPSALTDPIDLPPTSSRQIHVRSLIFDLAGDLDSSGQQVIGELIA